MRNKDGHPLPTEIRDRQAMFDACPDLLKRGRWICLNIEPNITWPVRPQSLIFAGQEVWIIPITKDDHPGVAMRQPQGLQREHADGPLLRLLSIIARRDNAGIAVAYRTGGDLPRMVGLYKKSGFGIRDAFDFTDVICPDEEEPRIALALMREARSLTGSAYAFMSYWRILEITFPKSAERIPWMQAKLADLNGHGVRSLRRDQGGRQRDGYVTRTVTPTKAPQIDYDLTDMAARFWTRAGACWMGAWSSGTHRRG